MSSDQTSKDARRTALAKALETMRARREALARETSATRRAVEAAAADKAEGSDAVELPRAARLAARAPPQPCSSPVVEPSAWEQRQAREINAFVRAKHHALRQREAEIRHAAARARKAPTKRRVAIRLPPAGQREDKLRAAANARQQQHMWRTQGDGR